MAELGRRSHTGFPPWIDSGLGVDTIASRTPQVSRPIVAISPAADRQQPVTRQLEEGQP
jgi:hypothetical protein